MAPTLFLVACASPKPTSSLPHKGHNPFPSYLLEQNVLWSIKNYSGKAVTVSSVSFAQTQNLVLTHLMKSIDSPLTPMNSTSQSHNSYRFRNWPTQYSVSALISEVELGLLWLVWRSTMWLSSGFKWKWLSLFF